MTERLPNISESAWANILGANDGSGGFLRVTHNDDGTLRPQLQVLATTAISADQNDWAPAGVSTAGLIEVSSNATRTITGMTAAGVAGRGVILLNAGSNTVQLTHEDSASVAANRFFIGNNAGAGNIFSLWAGSQIWLVYDGSRWRVVGNQNPGGSTPLIAGTATIGTSPFPSHQDHVHPSEGIASTGYTPTITQSVAVSKTVTWARSEQIGKMVHTWVALSVSGSGTTNNAIKVSTPTAAIAGAATALQFCGSGQIKLAGSLYGVMAYLFDANTFQFYRTDTIATDILGKDPNAALTANDVINFFAIYEAA